tara:strand:+ start:1040 stop:1159 length:120 start_codon:yes stop_codon:yes gene_type:complete
MWAIAEAECGDWEIRTFLVHPVFVYFLQLLRDERDARSA